MPLANFITCSRILLIIPVIYLTSIGGFIYNLLALIFFLLAGLTDYLDGYIARKTNTESSLGALLDLLADKLLVCVVLVWLVFLSNLNYLIFPVILIICRELIVSSLRQFIVEKIGINPVKVSYIGKSKTTVQFLAISTLIISPEFGYEINLLSIILTWLAAFISIYSLIGYIKSYSEFF